MRSFPLFFLRALLHRSDFFPRASVRFLIASNACPRPLLAPPEKNSISEKRIFPLSRVPDDRPQKSWLGTRKSDGFLIVIPVRLTFTTELHLTGRGGWKSANGETPACSSLDAYRELLLCPFFFLAQGPAIANSTFPLLPLVKRAPRFYFQRV